MCYWCHRHHQCSIIIILVIVTIFTNFIIISIIIFPSPGLPHLQIHSSPPLAPLFIRCGQAGIMADVCSAMEFVAPDRATSGLRSLERAAEAVKEEINKSR